MAISLKKIKADVFFTCLTGVLVLFFLCFISAFAKDEGTIGDSIVLNFLADAFGFIFPLLLLFKLLHQLSFAFFFLLAIVNVLIYTHVLSKLYVKLFSRIKGYKPFMGIFYMINGILILLLIYVLYLICVS